MQVTENIQQVPLKTSKKFSLKRDIQIILDNSSDIIHVLDSTGKIVYINCAVESLLGYLPSELIGKNLFDFIHPDDVSYAKEAFHLAIFNNSKNKPRDLRVLHKNGTWQIYESRGTTFLDESNRRFRVFNSRDITQRKKTEEQLRQSENKFKSVFTHAPIGMVIVDTKGHFLDCNLTMQKITGYSKPALQKMSFLDLTHPDDIGLTNNMYKHVVKNPLEIYQVDKRYITKKGEIIWVSVTAYFINDENNKPLYGIGLIEDITYRRKLDEKKVEFLSSIAHELKAPITTTKLVAQILKEKCKILKPGEDVSRAVHMLEKELNRLTHLINDLLDVSRFVNGKLKLKMERVNLTDLTNYVVDQMKLLAENRKIIVAKSPNYYINADPDRIQQVMTNFISNAIKYSNDKTKIKIRLKKNKGLVVYSVQDEGKGIPHNKLNHIFNQFFQVDEVTHEGFGLGLYINKKIIRQHHGRVWAESELGRGSTFYFSLPL